MQQSCKHLSTSYRLLSFSILCSVILRSARHRVAEPILDTAGDLSANFLFTEAEEAFNFKMASEDDKDSHNSDEVLTPLIQLQSKDYEEILNVIDQLRSEGISKYVNLPQLIVCGDQSSGKSSVLEAISGLGFPTKDNICTRSETCTWLWRHCLHSSRRQSSCRRERANPRVQVIHS